MLPRTGGAAAILKGVVPFERELSIIAVRDLRGEMAYYPLSENRHQDGILRVSTSLRDDPMQGLPLGSTALTGNCAMVRRNRLENQYAL